MFLATASVKHALALLDSLHSLAKYSVCQHPIHLTSATLAGHSTLSFLFANIFATALYGAEHVTIWHYPYTLLILITATLFGHLNSPSWAFLSTLQYSKRLFLLPLTAMVKICHYFHLFTLSAMLPKYICALTTIINLETKIAHSCLPNFLYLNHSFFHIHFFFICVLQDRRR